jgi:hypothetical protein
MKYFLPLRLGNDKIHSCWLEEKKNAHNSFFNFIIPFNKEKIFSISGNVEDCLLLPDISALPPVPLKSASLSFTRDANKIRIKIGQEDQPDDYTEAITRSEYLSKTVAEKNENFFLIKRIAEVKESKQNNLPPLRQENDPSIIEILKKLAESKGFSLPILVIIAIVPIFLLTLGLIFSFLFLTIMGSVLLLILILGLFVPFRTIKMPKMASRVLETSAPDSILYDFLFPANDAKDGSYEIEFEYEFQKAIYTDKIFVYITQAENIYDAAIDFGSEVCQIATGKREKAVDKTQHVAWNFSDFKTNYFNTSPSLADDKYFQYEISNENTLFKSIFFISNNSNKLKDFRQEFANSIFDENIDLVYDKVTELGTREIIPILKIAMLGGDRNYLTNFSEFNNDNEIKRSFYIYVVLRFARMIIKKIENERAENTTSFIKLHILIPNFYNQENIFQLLGIINKSLRTLIQNSKKIKGFEVQFTNESDAAFVGAKDSLNCAANKKYLIIDVGKGTTDISIIKVLKHNHEFEKIFSTGFIGAGQYLSTIFFDELLHLIINRAVDKNIELGNPTKVFQNIKAEIQKSGPVEKDQIQKLMDSLKHNFNNNGTETEILTEENVSIAKLSHSDGLSQARYGNFVSELRSTFEKLESVTFAGSNENIQKSIKDFVADILNVIPANYEFEKVLLTGRAVLLKTFKNLLSTEIRAKFRNVTEIVCPEKLDLKRCSIKGPFDRTIDLASDTSLLNTIEWDGNELGLKNIALGRNRKDNRIQPMVEEFIQSGTVKYRPDTQLLDTYKTGNVFIYFNGSQFYAYSLDAKNVFELQSQQMDQYTNQKYLNETLFPFFRS